MAGLPGVVIIESMPDVASSAVGGPGMQTLFRSPTTPRARLAQADQAADVADARHVADAGVGRGGRDERGQLVLGEMPGRAGRGVLAAVAAAADVPSRPRTLPSRWTLSW